MPKQVAILFALLAAAAPAAELMTNGSFESNPGEGTLPAGWTNQGSATTTVRATSSAAAAGTWSERTFGIGANGDHDVETTRRYVTFTREKVASAVAIAQSYWFEGNLVSTVGESRPPCVLHHSS